MTLLDAQSVYLSLRSKHLSPHTLRKYRLHCQTLATWAERQRFSLTGLRLLHLETFLAERPISQNTASKEAQFYRGFFRFCRRRGFLETSPAEDLEIPRFRPPAKQPYTQEEIAHILFACERVGQRAYERLRARAAILLLRHHALRISDVLALRRDAVQERDGRSFLRLEAHKNRREILHPLLPGVRQALDSLPLPVGSETSTKGQNNDSQGNRCDCKTTPQQGRGFSIDARSLGDCPATGGNERTLGRHDKVGSLQHRGDSTCPPNGINHYRHTTLNLISGVRISEYFFWNGIGRFQNVMDNMQAILRQVYRLSEVPEAHNHRFRHTRASEILAVGGSMQDVADFLGITARIAEKHYAKMMKERQDRMILLTERLQAFDFERASCANAERYL